MQFVTKRENLLSETFLVQGIVEKRSTRPILTNVLLESDADSVGIYATDLEVGLSSRFAAQVDQAGAITAPARKLADIVRLLPEKQDVLVEVMENNYLRITCGKIEYKLSGAPKEDFPVVPRFDFASGIEIPAQLLKAMIVRTLYAITAEETRYALNGAQISLDGESIKMVTTDAHRLAYVEQLFDGYDGEAIEILVPRKTVAELRTLIDERLDSVIFGHTENHLFFRIGERVLDSRVLEGQFPSYDKVLPKGNDKEIRLDRSTFSNAIGRVALLSHETSHAVRLSVTKGSLLVSSSNPEMGEAKEEIDAGYDGPELSIGFNAKYITDFIGSLETDEVILELKDEASAGLMRPGGDIEGVYKYVIMPMRI